MDHNPFISRNNDLFIMLIAGMAIHFASSYVLPLTIQTQFLIVLSFAFLAGLFMNYLYQSLEWALFFMLGVSLVAATPLLTLYLTEDSYTLPLLITHVLQTARYSFFLLSSWIVGIPVGFLLRKVLFGNYYRQGLF